MPTIVVMLRRKFPLSQKRPFVHNSVCSQFLEGLFAILAECSPFCLRPSNRNSRGNPSFCLMLMSTKLWTNILWTNWRSLLSEEQNPAEEIHPKQLECCKLKWGFKRWGFKQIWGYLGKRQGRKRQKKGKKGRFPGRAARHPLSPHLLHPHWRQAAPKKVHLNKFFEQFPLSCH